MPNQQHTDQQHAQPVRNAAAAENERAESISLPSVPVFQQRAIPQGDGGDGGNGPGDNTKRSSPLSQFTAQLKKVAAGVINRTLTQFKPADQLAKDNSVSAATNAFTAPVVQQKQHSSSSPVQRFEAPKSNRTGMPDNLKTGVENLSGLSMDDVRVNYNSPKPAQLQAHAYAQGTDIHIAPGQEKHLPHEAWHVAQQKQGRVKPTLQLKSGIPVNNSSELENEADNMGAKALESGNGFIADSYKTINMSQPSSQMPVQGTFIDAAAYLAQQVGAKGGMREMIDNFLDIDDMINSNKKMLNADQIAKARVIEKQADPDKKS